MEEDVSIYWMISRKQEETKLKEETWFQIDPGAHPVSYTVGTGSFPGLKRPGRGVANPPHLAPRVKKM
jgi:hypothetical protein